MFMNLSFPFWHSPNNGPRGKIPWIVHGANTISDSTFIVDYLAKTYAATTGKLGLLNLNLSATDSALHTAIQRLAEDSLASILPYSRFIDEEGAKFTMPVFFGKIPALIRPVIVKAIRVVVANNLHIIGFARFTNAEKLRIQYKNIDALSVLLGDKPYFGGSEPAIIDCVVFAFLENLVAFPIEYIGLRAHVDTKANLMTYVARVRGLLQAAK